MFHVTNYECPLKCSFHCWASTLALISEARFLALFYNIIDEPSHSLLYKTPSIIDFNNTWFENNYIYYECWQKYRRRPLQSSWLWLRAASVISLLGCRGRWSTRCWPRITCSEARDSRHRPRLPPPWPCSPSSTSSSCIQTCKRCLRGPTAAFRISESY